jgi:asparagine synthase (glutamine-hydrolysing)
MCGIIGFCGRPDTKLPAWENILSHRGNDSGGSYHDRGVHLYHNRLSINDLSPAARQPMSNENGNLRLICNGEIYNAPELRHQLQRRGHVFSSVSDNEVLLHLYEERGADMLADLRGMYAFCMYDKNDKELFLARDPFGIKPLVYAAIDSGFVFSSELRAFSLLPDFSKELDREALQLYRILNYIPAPFTIWKNARKLGPGSYLRVDGQGKIIEEKSFFRLAIGAWQKSSEDAVSSLDQTLQDSVKVHLLSDVAVGVLLSGGLDSSLIAALARKQLREPLLTFSVGFPEVPYYDESARARAVAGYLGTRHTEIKVTSRESFAILEAALDHLDEPFADSSLIAYAIVSKKARESVKVALSGDGGDELFAGYTKYQGLKLAQALGFLTPLLKLCSALPFKEDRSSVWRDTVRQIRKLYSFSCADGMTRLMKSIAYDYQPNEWFSGEILRLAEEAGRQGLSGLNSALYVDSRFELPYDMFWKSDTASMQYGLEVRVPFVDLRVAELAFSLPEQWKLNGFQRKWILKEVARKYLPRGIVYGRKKGFGVPVGEWIRTTLLNDFKDAFSDQGIRRIPGMDPGNLSRLLKEHLSRKHDRFWQLWNAFVLIRWWRSYGG